ncbi:type IV pilus secretin PilQ [Vibrio tritonius]|uniref:Type IV pilus secretin PilQ n=1 Tax=Vibrio tritonius TaxID=1435069 RepID=A0ABS7YG99_9VIBR|nr:type IV pilus secretin PilQ [Vibrio tritonius]MCA2014693.1 type IV pilus secretin PilQ [Vibrio tritonius]
MKQNLLLCLIVKSAVVILSFACMSSFAFAADEKEELISLQLQDAEVRRLLVLLAQQRHMNLVMSDSVAGNVSVNLDNVSWNKALNIILKMKGLAHKEESGVLWIAPRDELVNMEKEQRKIRLDKQPLSYLRVPIHYALAKNIADMVAKSGLLSPRGSVQIDKRTNALLLKETAQGLKELQAFIQSLDIPMKQVLIEARIVTMSQGNLDELGVRWGIFQSNQTNLGGSLEGLQGADSEDIMGQLNVHLPSASARASSIAFQVAKLGADTLLDLELSALQSESKAEIISSPRLVTTNKKPAYIEQGTEIPYLEAASSGATSVTFRKAVLSLKVTPQITPDNRLILDLNVTQDRPGNAVSSGTGDAVTIQTQRIGTQVLVNNGETVVLGGIYQYSTIHHVDKVPLLGDLPWIGSLFRRTYQQSGKNELLIFVTPKVFIQ